jgi:hypothetical protein
MKKERRTINKMRVTEVSVTAYGLEIGGRVEEWGDAKEHDEARETTTNVEEVRTD